VHGLKSGRPALTTVGPGGWLDQCDRNITVQKHSACGAFVWIWSQALDDYKARKLGGLHNRNIP
jgi:hypothetical protein